MTGELCSQPPLGVAETRLPNLSATSRWQVSPSPSSGEDTSADLASGSPAPWPWWPSRRAAGAGPPRAKPASANSGSRGSAPPGAPGMNSPELSWPTSFLRSAA